MAWRAGGGRFVYIIEERKKRLLQVPRAACWRSSLKAHSTALAFSPCTFAVSLSLFFAYIYSVARTTHTHTYVGKIHPSTRARRAIYILHAKIYKGPSSSSTAWWWHVDQRDTQGSWPVRRWRERGLKKNVLLKEIQISHASERGGILNECDDDDDDDDN